MPAVILNGVTLNSTQLNELYALALAAGTGATSDAAWIKDVIAGLGTNGGHKFIKHLIHVANTTGSVDTVIQDIANHSSSAEQAALLAAIDAGSGTPTTYTLTTTPGDVINSTVPGDVVIGNAGGFDQTFLNGDVITGIPGTTVEITTTASTYLPGVVTIDPVGVVDIIAAASNTYNALLWSGGIGTIEVSPGSAQNTVTGISNAPMGPSYDLNAGAGNNASLYVGFQSSGAENFGLLGSGSSTAWATLDATGTTAWANGLADAVTAATIATTGTNYDYVNLGTNDHSVTLTGNGVDTISFGPLATSGGLTVDWSTMFGGHQNLTFAWGALDTDTGNTVTITGGGSDNSVTADGMTGTESLTMSGVQSLTTTFEGDTTFDGTHVTGLETITLNAPMVEGSDTFVNMSDSVTALNVNGPAGPVSFEYASGTPAPDLTVTFGGNSGPVVFDGLSTSNVKEVTVVFNDAGGFTGATGSVNIDQTTTSLTLENTAAGSEVYLYVDPLTPVALTSFTETAVADGSSICVENELISYGSNMSVTVTSEGNSSFAYLGSVTGLASLGEVTVNAVGDDSGANIGSVAVDGNIGSVDVTASGASSQAIICGEVCFVETSGLLGEVNITATGSYADAYLGSIYMDGGSVTGEITVTAGGVGLNEAGIGTISDAFDIGSIAVVASGEGSCAFISSVQCDYLIETINVTASNEPSDAYIGCITAGEIVSIATLASGNDSDAYIGSVNVEDLGSLSITASGNYSDSYVDCLNAYSVGAISVTASGHDAEASVGAEIDYLGSLSVTASGTDSEATAEVSVDHLTSASVSATGSGSEATLAVDVYDTQITITAVAAAKAEAYVYLDSYVSTYAGGAGTINASGAGHLYVEISDEVPGAVNAANTGGFEYYVDSPGYGSNPTTQTTITSASTANYIQAGYGPETVSAANAGTVAAPGHGNTFDFTVDPMNVSGLGILSILGPNQTILSGFQSGGANWNGGAGQLILSPEETGVGHTATSISFSPGALATTAASFAAAAVAVLTGTAGIAYAFGTDGTNGWLAVDDTTSAHHVTNIVELVGINGTPGHTFAASDIIA